MASSLRRLRGFSRVLNHVRSGNFYVWPIRVVCFNGSLSIPSGHGRINVISRFLLDKGFVVQRFSTVAEPSQESIVEDDLLSFIKSTLDNREGSHHCWLNELEIGNSLRGKNDVFLVLAGAFPLDSAASGCNADHMFEKAKLLQQRYPKLHVIGFQSNLATLTQAVCVLSRMTVEGYITFPILLSSKTFTEVASGTRIILLKGFESPAVTYEGNVEIGVIDRAVKDLMLPGDAQEDKIKRTWVKEAEAIKSPLACSSMQNLLLHFPGCISADERSNRLFLSDTNHHRIIIFDGSGKILDCIGSSPGFEDGDFEVAKLMRPAASFYQETEDCIYFVDSENHAIRKADMEQRVVETLYPSSTANKKSDSLWRWIKDKFWTEKVTNDNSENLDSESLMFPWHLIESSENDIIVLNQNLDTLWIMDLASGVIKETVKGFPTILEICGQLILEKLSHTKKIPSEILQNEVDIEGSFNGFQHAGLVSSIAKFHDHVVICDKVGQRVVKIQKETGILSSFNFSNFGILGLPYWVASPLERVYFSGDASPTIHVDHVEKVSLLPGKIDIQLNIDLPEDTELIEPLQEGCVWRQARGAVTEVSGAESKEASTEKVGMAQQWYDEIDHLVSPQEVELKTEEESPSEGSIPEEGACIDCTVHTSPGTSEVVISAALYLKLKRNSNSIGDSKEEQAARIADILTPKGAEKIGRDPLIHFLMNSKSSLEEVVFMKPLNVRLKFDTCNHPKAKNSKDFVLSNSSVEVNVSLE